MKKVIKGKRRGRNELEFGLLKHGGGVIIAVAGEPIDGEAMAPFPIPAQMVNVLPQYCSISLVKLCGTAILPHSFNPNSAIISSH